MVSHAEMDFVLAQAGLPLCTRDLGLMILSGLILYVFELVHD